MLRSPFSRDVQPADLGGGLQEERLGVGRSGPTRPPSLLPIGFGFDSWIEVTAAAVVLRRLRAEAAGAEPDEAKERRALRAVAVTFFVLAIYVTVEAVRDLVVGDEPSITVVGMFLTALSAVVMPALARRKRGFAAFGLSWIDPVAGFVIAFFAVREGREAWEGDLVCDDD